MQVLGTPRNVNGTGATGARRTPALAAHVSRGLVVLAAHGGPAAHDSRMMRTVLSLAAAGGRQWRLARIHHHGCSGVVSWGFLVRKGSLKDEGGGTLLFW